MKESEFDYINVIPLVDVMLVLLTIVLTTSTFIATGAISVSLPKASSSQMEALKRQTIAIDREGSSTSTTGSSSWANWTERSGTGQRNAHDPSCRPVHPAQAFIDVLDLLNRRGFKKVAIQTEQKK